MSGASWPVINDRLTQEARSLLVEMVDEHQAGEGTSHRHFLASRSNRGTQLTYLGAGSGKPRTSRPVDEVALNDLAGYGLLRRTRSDRNSTRYEVSGETLAFYRWLRLHEGQPVDVVADTIVSHVDGPAFAQRHPACATQLRQALALLSSTSVTDPATAHTIGHHLRQAVIEIVGGIAAPTKDPEDVHKHLKAWLAARPAGRDAVVLEQLVELTRAVLRLDQRLDHLRDTISDGEPDLTWDEARRAVFVTTMCCHELDRAATS